MIREARDTRWRPPRRSAANIWLLGLALLMLPARALAQAPAAPPATRAAKLAAAAKRQFELGAFRAAERLYAQAYQLHALPKYLYNVGLSRLRLGGLERLKRAEINFLACSKKAAPRLRRAAELQLARVRRLIAAVEARAAASKPTRATPPASAPASKPTAKKTPPWLAPRPRRGFGAPPRRDTPIYKRWWLWTLVGVAVAGGTTAVLLLTLRDTRLPAGERVDSASLTLGSSARGLRW